MTTIGEIADIINGGTPSTSVDSYWDGDVQWVTPKDLGQLKCRYISSGERTITIEGVKHSSAKILPPHSLILSSRAPIGYVAINTVPMATNQGCKGIIPSDRVLSEYLFYYLLFCNELLNSLGTGATFKELSGTKLSTVSLPLPSPEEQQRIVGILDAEFEKIDALKANAEKNLQNAKDLFQAALKKELEPKDGWNWVCLPSLSENLDSKRIPITQKDRTEGHYPYYGASGIVDYVSDYIFDDELLLISEDGANLLARSTPIAFSVSGKIWVNNHAHILKFNDMATQKIVEYYIASISIDEYVTGAAQPKLTQANMNKIAIPMPPLEKRTEIVDRLTILQERTKTLQDNHTQTIALCDDLKQALLRKAFNGDL